ncbi:ATP-binding protein [Acidobacterium sp. S8]|uniref:ATP-binding protein n=1 Tax=Acidobacterium sp. S8 TaxID=1641854 RepID=UPI00131C299F|nr:ATP-binding protein [Acidobacterium sp. S8]
MSRNSLLLKMELRSDPRMLCVVRAALGQLGESAGFLPEEVRSMVLAVDEAMTNVIRHAYHGRIDQPIEVDCRHSQLLDNGVLRDALEIVLKDKGVRVKAEELRGRPLDEVRPGGLGLQFIRESMDSVRFRHQKGTNRLHLVKFLRQAEPRQEAEGGVVCN